MTTEEPGKEDCNCAPGVDGLVIHNSWAHIEKPESLVEQAVALRLASDSKIMSDGYPSLIVHTNEEAAEILVAAGWVGPDERQAISEQAWDACLDAIDQNELNTEQARQGNPYRKIS